MEDTSDNTSQRICLRRTPRARDKLRFNLASNDEIQDSINALEELLYKTWTIFGVSTLFNFHQDEVHLKQYAKRLREEVAMSLSQEDVVYNAKLYVMTNVEIRPSPMDPPPIKIEVYAKKYNSEEDYIEKCIYKGIFLSWRTIDKELPMSNCIRLPLLLCHGSKSAMKIVHRTLSHMFDCIIIALNALEEDLVWLVPIVITPTNDEEYPKHTDTICMEYKLTTSDADIIIIHFKISDLIRIVKMYLKDENDEANVEITFDSDHVDKCREALHTQMLHIAGLQMGQCILYKITLPTFTITANKMKIRSMNVMNRILLYLNKKALDICHTYNFEMF